MTYLAKPFPGELVATRSARGVLRKTGDFKEALKNFPSYLHYEIAMLNYLVEHPGDFASSFDVLAPSLKHLFVHAYQSYLFNRILSRRLSFGLPLNRAMEGDVVCFSKGDLPDISKLQAVTADNLDAINRLMEHGRAYVTLPLLGYESRIGPGPEGDIERSVLEDEGLGDEPSSLEGFRVHQNTELGSKGLRRSVLLRVSPRYVVGPDFAELEFFLPAGSYATVVLREFMKSGSLITGQ
jgi:tRNA pseudouridine13 synthase